MTELEKRIYDRSKEINGNYKFWLKHGDKNAHINPYVKARKKLKLW